MASSRLNSGGIDILVNNAATNLVFGSVFDIEEKAWDVTIGPEPQGLLFPEPKSWQDNAG